MRRAVLVLALVALAVASGSSLAAPSVAVTDTQLQKRFKAATGDTLRRDTASSYAGRYKAFSFGRYPSLSMKAKYGQPTLYVVVAGDLEAAVNELLVDGHTGELGQPDAKGIYWERGITLRGDEYWLAKKRYGDNLVLWWITESEGTDRRFARLDKVIRTKVFRAAQ
jgi:hypothetical protein